MQGELKVISGTANKSLALEVAKYLKIKLTPVDIHKFSDGEIYVRILESVRGSDVYIIQPTSPDANLNLMELLITVDALKRSSPQRITAVIPYFGYARQDRKDQPRVAITAKLIANLITVAGADRVMTMDLHAAQLQGFFDIPFDHLYGSTVFSGLVKNEDGNTVVVSPDVGGLKMARSYAKRIQADLVVIDKRRPHQNLAEVVNIIGDVKNKNVLIVDDLIDTAGTFVGAIEALKDKGAKDIFGAITHPLFSGPAIKRIKESQLTKLYVTDSIPLNTEGIEDKIFVVTASNLFAEAIKRTFNNESISSLFEIDKG
ncbi:MAG: ribose-phosphate pyrophosphokinase [Bacteroidetes bacterium]|nr:ribose-phosphate pyrophosphokinase [Bacteroidota bacterium]